jgi:hypothetical protein
MDDISSSSFKRLEDDVDDIYLRLYLQTIIVRSVKQSYVSRLCFTLQSVLGHSGCRWDLVYMIILLLFYTIVFLFY